MIFDLDGTIGDTLPLCLAAFKKAIEPLSSKKISDREIYDTFGPSEEGTITGLLPPELFDEGLHAYWRWYRALHGMCPEPFPGMVGILEDIRERGVFLGLITGKAKTSADISLERFGLADFFDDCEFGSPKGPRKPEAIRAMLGRNGLDAAGTVYVGDTPSDVTSAREAGVGVVAAAWAGTAEPERLAALAPDRLFRTVGEFAAYVGEILQEGKQEGKQ